MIAQLNGKVIRAGDGFVVIMVGGVGFQVAMPVPDLEEISRQKGEEKAAIPRTPTPSAKAAHKSCACGKKASIKI